MRLTFRVRYHTNFGQSLLLTGDHEMWCILGSELALENWNTTKPVLLQRNLDDDFFSVQIDLFNGPFPIEYKYGVYDLESKTFVRFEDGPNRVLSDSIAAQKHTIVNDGFAALPCTSWKGAGVA